MPRKRAAGEILRSTKIDSHTRTIIQYNTFHLLDITPPNTITMLPDSSAPAADMMSDKETIQTIITNYCTFTDHQKTIFRARIDAITAFNKKMKEKQ